MGTLKFSLFTTFSMCFFQSKTCKIILFGLLVVDLSLITAVEGLKDGIKAKKVRTSIIIIEVLQIITQCLANIQKIPVPISVVSSAAPNNLQIHLIY